jgi:glucosylceramidase
MKQVSHYVKPGAKRLETTGDFNNLLAFLNPDKIIAIIIQNGNNEGKIVRIKVGNKMIKPFLKGDLFNTFVIK